MSGLTKEGSLLAEKYGAIVRLLAGDSQDILPSIAAIFGEHPNLFWFRKDISSPILLMHAVSEVNKGNKKALLLMDHYASNPSLKSYLPSIFPGFINTVFQQKNVQYFDARYFKRLLSHLNITELTHYLESEINLGFGKTPLSLMLQRQDPTDGLAMAKILLEAECLKRQPQFLALLIFAFADKFHMKKADFARLLKQNCTIDERIMALALTVTDANALEYFNLDEGYQYQKHIQEPDIEDYQSEGLLSDSDSIGDYTDAEYSSDDEDDNYELVAEEGDKPNSLITFYNEVLTQKLSAPHLHYAHAFDLSREKEGEPDCFLLRIISVEVQGQILTFGQFETEKVVSTRAISRRFDRHFSAVERIKADEVAEFFANYYPSYVPLEEIFAYHYKFDQYDLDVTLKNVQGRLALVFLYKQPASPMPEQYQLHIKSWMIEHYCSTKVRLISHMQYQLYQCQKSARPFKLDSHFFTTFLEGDVQSSSMNFTIPPFSGSLMVRSPTPPVLNKKTPVNSGAHYAAALPIMEYQTDFEFDPKPLWGCRVLEGVDVKDLKSAFGSEIKQYDLTNLDDVEALKRATSQSRKAALEKLGKDSIDFKPLDAKGTMIAKGCVAAGNKFVIAQAPMVAPGAMTLRFPDKVEDMPEVGSYIEYVGEVIRNPSHARTFSAYLYDLAPLQSNPEDDIALDALYVTGPASFVNDSEDPNMKNEVHGQKGLLRYMGGGIPGGHLSYFYGFNYFKAYRELAPKRRFINQDDTMTVQALFEQKPDDYVYITLPHEIRKVLGLQAHTRLCVPKHIAEIFLAKKVREDFRPSQRRYVLEIDPVSGLLIPDHEQSMVSDLMIACYMASPWALHLLRCGAAAGRRHRQTGDSAFHYLLKGCGSTDEKKILTECLIQSNAPLYLQGVDDLTVLHLAAKEGLKEVVNLILSKAHSVSNLRAREHPMSSMEYDLLQYTANSRDYGINDLEPSQMALLYRQFETFNTIERSNLRKKTTAGAVYVKEDAQVLEAIFKVLADPKSETRKSDLKNAYTGLVYYYPGKAQGEAALSLNDYIFEVSKLSFLPAEVLRGLKQVDVRSRHRFKAVKCAFAMISLQKTLLKICEGSEASERINALRYDQMHASVHAYLENKKGPSKKSMLEVAITFAKLIDLPIQPQFLIAKSMTKSDLFKAKSAFFNVKKKAPQLPGSAIDSLLDLRSKSAPETVKPAKVHPLFTLGGNQPAQTDYKKANIQAPPPKKRVKLNSGLVPL